MLTNITKEEKKRFKNFQDQGMLPSAALDRIETERRFPELKEEYPLGKDVLGNKLSYLAIGGIGIAILYVIISKKTATSQSMVNMKTLSLDNIPGIDLNSLQICRHNKLM